MSSNSGGRIEWVGGLYYLDNYDNNLSRSRYGSDAGAWNASAAQYGVLDTTAAGQLLMENSQDRVYRGTQQVDTTEAAAGFGHINVHITDPFTLGLGLRFTHQDRTIVQSGEVLDQGFGTNLDPVAINNVQLNGFNSNATTGALAAGNTAAQLAVANQVAQQYFGVASYGTLTTAQLAQGGKRQVAARQRAWQPVPANGRHTLYGMAAEWRGVAQLQDQRRYHALFHLPARRKVGCDADQYRHECRRQRLSARAGGVELVRAGLEQQVPGQHPDHQRRCYLDNVYNFQQTVYYFDAAATALAANGTPVYASGNGNVPWVQLKGFEVDSVYSGIEGLQLRLSGSYNDAIYKSYGFAARPAEQGNLTPAFRSLNGSVLPNAPKVRFDLDANYHRSLFGGVVHTDVDYAYQGRQNTDAALSTYGWVGGLWTGEFRGGILDRKGWLRRKPGVQEYLPEPVRLSAQLEQLHAGKSGLVWAAHRLQVLLIHRRGSRAPLAAAPGEWLLSGHGSEANPSLFSTHSCTLGSRIRSLPGCFETVAANAHSFGSSRSVHLRAGMVTVKDRVNTAGSVMTAS